MADVEFYRTTITAVLYGQQIQNVLCTHGPVEDLIALNTLNNEMKTIWVDHMKKIQTDTLRYVNITSQAIGGSLGPRSLTINVPGLASANSNNDPCQALVVRLRTNQAGKHGKGRVYIAGLHNNNWNEGITTAACVTFMQGIFDDILGTVGFDSSPFKLGVKGKAPGSPFFEVTHMECAPTCGHQRRRNIGIGI